MRSDRLRNIAFDLEPEQSFHPDFYPKPAKPEEFAGRENSVAEFGACFDMVAELLGRQRDLPIGLGPSQGVVKGGFNDSIGPNPRSIRGDSLQGCGNLRLRTRLENSFRGGQHAVPPLWVARVYVV
jgi:hypothetical protein